MTTYDAITDQFDPALSGLARRMYAVIYEMTSKTAAKIYMLAGEINDALDTDITCIGGPGEDALRSLIKANLISFNPGEWFRYYLSCAAWRAHLLAEQAEREQTIRDIAREIVEAWDAATGPTEAAWKIAAVLPRLRAALSDKSDEDALLTDATGDRC